MKYLERKTKRIFDIIVALLTIVLFAPLFLVCYLAIKLDDGGDAIFSQERIGYKGRPFRIYKFRSMNPNAEENVPALYTDNDSRLTRVGAFLRKHHLDEMPQLWNVLRGDMSFVGPRPERKYFIDKIIEIDDRYPQLYKIRPGVTSYATLYNGYTDTMDKMLRRLELDLYYLEHNSLWFDMKILAKTFGCIVLGKKI
ncbi:MAG: sugar transferase [Prevotella sp.]|nr:sugar transferase [Prevotella sp.]